jgi:cation diffusion facilitator CzcD-associated flavoprotein CzcO
MSDLAIPAAALQIFSPAMVECVWVIAMEPATNEGLGQAPIPTRVIIVGAGFGGIGLAIKLKQAGLNDFIILEKLESVGGVWHQNQYPGAACDVPSHLYSFSFEPRADWPDKFARQGDILDYLVNCVRKHGLESHIRLAAEAVELRWDETSSRWIVRTGSGTAFAAQAEVTAVGQLSRPSMPQLPGLPRFAGAAFHSAAWPKNFEPGGRNVAVIGTGASAIQFVPAIAPLVNKLYVFQRSAAYVLGKPDKPYAGWQKFLFDHIPGLLRLSRTLIYLRHEMRAIAFVTIRSALAFGRVLFRRHLGRGVAQPDLRRLLTPDYRFGCKRVLISNDFYPAMDRANVELITIGISEIRPDAIVTADSAVRKVDCIIFGTGFAASDFLMPMKIVGRGGRDLHQSWKDGADAYLGMAIAGFPNFFMLYGPNTNLAHNSIICMIESQIRYVIACLRRLDDGDFRTIEIKSDAQKRFNERIQARLQKFVWAKGCTSWYLSPDGKNTANWPGYSFGFMMRTRAPKWDDYAVQ